MQKYSTYNGIALEKTVHRHYLITLDGHKVHNTSQKTTTPQIILSAAWKIYALNISLLVVFYFMYVYINISHTNFPNSAQGFLLICQIRHLSPPLISKLYPHDSQKFISNCLQKFLTFIQSKNMFNGFHFYIIKSTSIFSK